MRHKNILVLGGSGFVGRHLVARLVAGGRNVRVPTRRLARARPLTVLPTVQVLEADVMDPATLPRLLAGQDAVVNLVGVLHASSTQFQQVHVDFVRRVMEAAAKAKVKRVLHMSALGADRNGASLYQRSRGDGEAVVRQSQALWTIYQPSAIFGPEDRFLNLFACVARFLPALPIARCNTRLQPAAVGDVVNAMVNTLDCIGAYRKSFELCGPEIMTLGEVAALAAAASGYPRRVWALPDRLAYLQAWLMEHMPGPTLLSADSLDSLGRDIVASRQPYVPDPVLGMRLTPMRIVAEHMLAGRGRNARFDEWRAHASR